MPSPEQIRHLRIEELFKEFNGKPIPMFDVILRRAQDKFPMVQESKCREYANAVLRMLQASAIKKAKQ